MLILPVRWLPHVTTCEVARAPPSIIASVSSWMHWDKNYELGKPTSRQELLEVGALKQIWESFEFYMERHVSKWIITAWFRARLQAMPRPPRVGKNPWPRRQHQILPVAQERGHSCIPHLIHLKALSQCNHQRLECGKPQVETRFPLSLKLSFKWIMP